MGLKKREKDTNNIQQYLLRKKKCDKKLTKYFY